MKRSLLVFFSVFAASSASAQTYPFEGRWTDDNPCRDGLHITSAGMRDPGGFCRFTRVTQVDATSFRYSASCRTEVGNFNTTGTLTLLSPNRLRHTDKDGPYDRTRC